MLEYNITHGRAPTKEHLLAQLQSFWHFLDELSVADVPLNHQVSPGNRATKHTAQDPSISQWLWVLPFFFPKTQFSDPRSEIYQSSLLLLLATENKPARKPCFLTLTRQDLENLSQKTSLGSKTHTIYSQLTTTAISAHWTSAPTPNSSPRHPRHSISLPRG